MKKQIQVEMNTDKAQALLDTINVWREQNNVTWRKLVLNGIALQAPELSLSINHYLNSIKYTKGAK